MIVLWLDDYRNPFARVDSVRTWVDTYCKEYPRTVIWLKTKQEFELYILSNPLPDLICFDNDLGYDGGEGYDCAKFLVEYCMDNDLKLPNFVVQSANVVAKENIESLLNNFKKFQQ